MAYCSGIFGVSEVKADGTGKQNNLTDIVTYMLLILSAFLSATLLPGSSEVTLLALLTRGQHAPVTLILAATFGNVLGAVVNWMLGRYFAHFQHRSWFPIDGKTMTNAQGWYGRYGTWSLLLSWVPVIGDPLTVVAGVLRVDLSRFLLLVTLGKAARYMAIGLAYFAWSGG